MSTMAGQAAPAGMTAALAEWAASVGAGDLPDDVAADVPLRVLDVVGLVLGAAGTPIGQAVRRAAQTMGEGGAVRSLGHGDRLPAGLAALVDGTLAHAADFDDTHDLSVTHPSCAMVPCALALGQQLRLSGADVVRWVAVGNEINCRIASGAPGGFHRHGFHPTGVVGTLPLATVATLAAGATPPQALNAAGIAGSQAAGLMEAFADGTWSKTLHPGWACHAGMAAAALARAGFTGPATILEGRFGLFRSHVQDAGYAFLDDQVTGDLGGTWRMLDTSFKPYPCAHAIHAFVDAALDLRRAHGLAAADIVSVRPLVGARYVELICEPMAAKRRPLTPTHARASLAYALAAALVRGALGPADYEAAAIGDPAVLALADRVDYAIDPDAPPGTFRGIVEIATADGRVLRHLVPHNRGSRANPMGRDGLVAKFRDGAGRLDRAGQDRLIAAIDGLGRATSVDRLVGACL